MQLRLVENENKLMDALKGNVPDDCKILFEMQKSMVSQRIVKTPYLVKNKGWNINKMITDIKIEFDNKYNLPGIIIKLNSTGTEIFKTITAENINKRLAIILDNRLLSAPIIHEQISTGQFRISGDNTEEMRDIALLLNAGSYPIPATILAEYTK